MIRLALFVLLVLAALPQTARAETEVVRFTQEARIDGARLPIPMQLYLSELSETRIAVTLAGDLGRVQAAIPALLSRRLEETCERDIAIAVTDARAEGANIRLTGQLQASIYGCRDTGERQIREMLLRQTASVSALLGGRIEGGCLVARVIDTDVRPDGLTGALFDAVGYTPRLNRDLEAQLSRALREQDGCFDLPEEFQAVDTRITGGGFRDLGDGRIGAQIHATMEITAANVIRLIGILDAQGQFGD